MVPNVNIKFYMNISTLFSVKHVCVFIHPVAIFLFSLLLSSCANSEVEPPFTSKLDKEKISNQYIPSDESLDAAKYAKERLLYVSALDAYVEGDMSTVRNLMNNELKDYPLNIYLEYQLLQTQSADIKDVLTFINSGKHDLLANRLKAFYIAKYAKSKQYTNLLRISPKLPNSPYLQCYWYEAQYHTGNEKLALKNMRVLYRSGKSISNSCIDFVVELRKSKKLTDSDLYARMDEAYWTRHGYKVFINSANLLKKTEYKKAMLLLEKLYNTPQKYNTVPSGFNSVAATVFKRYARIEPLEAHKEFASFKKKYKITNAQEKSIEKVMVAAMLYEKEDVPYNYLDRQLALINSSDLYQHRIRTAIWQKDYKTVEKFIRLLPKDLQKAENNQYWLARALEASGNKNQANLIFNELAKARSFYGYMAAEKVNKPYVINDAVINLNKTRTQLLKTNIGYERFVEFDLLSDPKGLKTEWNELMSKASLEDARMIATIEAKRGYTDLAIWESIIKKDWDTLKLRFPLSYIDNYKQQAAAQNVKVTFLLGITRQESIMNPLAVSPVGARGLMQIMPGTAKLISKKNGYEYKGVNSLFDPKVNILFGASYIRELLGKFNNNRIYVAASYNAGPGRALRWQSQDDVKRDMATYVESIPFDETRNYVQKVIFYDFMYQYLLGVKKPIFLTDSERNSNY